MSLVFATKSKLTAIANAIRTRSGSASSMTLDQMAAAIPSLPNTYSAGDEGKVVSSGALVAQTAHADVTPTTSDQTIDTTTNNSIKVKGDADLIAGNIKKDVEIFGVTGTYEGGGGGTPTFGLLTTINITSAVATITYSLPSLAADFGTVWIVCDNVTFSAKDYCYFAVLSSSGTPADNNGYLPQATSFNGNIICVFGQGRTVGNVTLSGYSGSNWNTNAGTYNRIMRINDVPDTLKGKFYNGGTTFTGGTIYVYGRVS